jgi:hypothetical protein
MRLLVSLPLFALASSLAHAQETYTIQLKLDPGVGKTVTSRSHDVSTGSMKFFDADGKLLAEHKKEGSEDSYRLTVLEADKDGQPTKFVRVYDKANEKEDGKTKTFSYQGRTVLFEKVDGKFRLGVAGEPALDGKDVEKLLKKANKKGAADGLLRNLPPSKPVKVGDSWNVPVKPVADSMDDMPVDVKDSTITAKLVKVYPKGKSQFGSFEVELKMVLKGEVEDEGAVMKFDSDTTLSASLTVDAAIDASTTERKELGTMAMKGEGKMTAGGMNLRMVFDMKGKGGEEVSAETDDPKARILPKVVFAAGPGEWTVFKHKEFAFEAKFPGTPETKSSTKNGNTTTEFGVQADEKRIWYAVTITEYPADKVKLDAAAVYANLKKVPNIKESADIKIAGLPAVELKQDVKQAKTVHVTQRVLVVGQRMYQLLVVVEEGRKADAKEFFDSFKLDVKAATKKDD